VVNEYSEPGRNPQDRVEANRSGSDNRPKLAAIFFASTVPKWLSERE